MYVFFFQLFHSRKTSPESFYFKVENVRSIELKDFEDAFSLVRSSVGEEELVGYQTWNKQYGSFPITHDEEAS